MSTFKLSDAAETCSSELMIFGPLETETGVLKTQWIEYNPQSTIQDTIEFTIPGTSSNYLDLKNTRLFLRAKITKNGETLPEKEHIAFINNAIHSCFTQVDVYFQKKLVYSSGSLYFMKAYLDNLLNYSTDSSTSQLGSQLFYLDTAGKESMESTNGVSRTPPLNSGLTARTTFTAKSAIVDMEGPILASVFNLSRYMLNGVEIVIKLTQSRDKLRLMAKEDADYKVVIEKATLKVCTITVAPSITTAHNEVLKEHNAIYPYMRDEMKIYSISKGQYNLDYTDIFTGSIPQKLIIGFVNSESINGSYQLNPFNFYHYFLSSLVVTVDDSPIPTKEMQMKYIETKDTNDKETTISGNWITAYQSIYTGMQTIGSDVGSVIKRHEYPLGYCIYIFDLTAHSSKQNDEEFPLVKHGVLKISGTFETALPHTVNMVVLGSFANVIEVDQARSVIINKL